MIDESVQSDILTVTEYSARLGRALRDVGSATLEGEVQKVHPTPRGMLYFDLTDGDALLSCKVFARDAARLDHTPRAGDLVQVRVDRPDLYAARGSVSLIVSEVSLAGEGELLRRRAALLERLSQEGLCAAERRRPLPRFPRAVGLIAGQASDGMSDVIRALTDRWPAVHIITCASLVQGKGAPAQLIDAMARLQDNPLVDVIVMARGGGSVQDLVCFDDEGLCRALFACEVPVVCAIGHTDNNPVCNHVAWPAFTPSRSAELVVPSAAELRRTVVIAGERLGSVAERVDLAAERVQAQAGRVNCAPALEARAASLAAAGHTLAHSGEHLASIARNVNDRGAELRTGAERGLDAARREMTHRVELIAAQDFRRRGWLLASGEDGAPIRSTADLRAGGRLELHLHDGSAQAVVDTITPNSGRTQ